jgi:hypothetical protein
MNDSGGLLSDLLHVFNKHLEDNNILLHRLYDHWQRIEADKTPGQWRPTTILLNCATLPIGSPGSFQIMRAEPRRKSADVFNQGPDDIFISNLEFDGPSIKQGISDPANPDTVLPAPLQVVEIGILPSGSATTINSTGSIFAFNLASSGALLSILENLYQGSASIPQRITQPGMDGVQGQGYGSTGVKVLR